mmetsp:Transcript_41995/g.64310  ORF Transcript_41995/g.64310 Transcript_41995/m.64310 type:complete len:204 (-) Transcript_41995:2090-2701(-)
MYMLLRDLLGLHLRLKGWHRLLLPHGRKLLLLSHGLVQRGLHRSILALRGVALLRVVGVLSRDLSAALTTHDLVAARSGICLTWLSWLARLTRLARLPSCWVHLGKSFEHFDHFGRRPHALRSLEFGFLSTSSSQQILPRHSGVQRDHLGHLRQNRFWVGPSLSCRGQLIQHALSDRVITSVHLVGTCHRWSRIHGLRRSRNS